MVRQRERKTVCSWHRSHSHAQSSLTVILQCTRRPANTVKESVHALNHSHSLTHPHTHKHCFYDSFSDSSAARFTHETHMDFHKISGTNRDDRKHCSWPTFLHPHDQDGMQAQKQTVDQFICLDKIIRRVLFIDAQIEQLDLNVRAN